MIKNLFTFTFICLIAGSTGANEVLSLSQCIKIGIENNLTLQTK